MNQETVFRALMSLGLTEKDVQVYIFLAKTGPKRSEQIARAVKTDLKQICQCLGNLQEKGIVDAITKSAWFEALPFEKVIDIIARTRRVEADNIQRNREKLLSNFDSLFSSDQDS